MNLQVNSYFNNIQNIVIKDIQEAKEEILIAVAWFTNDTIFNQIIEKLKANVVVKLIIINDDINNRPHGLDFQEFIDNKGVLYFSEKSIPMHNKYIIIDKRIVITGSYNFTYLAEHINNENIIRICGFDEISKNYISDFESITEGSSSILSVQKYLEKHPPFSNLFSYNNYGIKDIYQQSIILKEKGQIEQSATLMKEIDIADTPPESFTIEDVVYRQWNKDYLIDNITVEGNLLKIRFRTYCECGSYINSPGTKWEWILRNSFNHNSYTSSVKIENVCINKQKRFAWLKEKTIYTLDVEPKPNWSTENDHGYKLNESNRLIDDAGKPVPVNFVKISKGRNEVSCDIFFDISKLDITGGIVDLLEGIDCETMDNHWHCFEINLNLNRKRIE